MVRRDPQMKIVGLVLDLIQPKSVIDVGCGIGTWLSVFKERGIDDILGLDGEYIQRDLLRIPAEKFLAVDLKKPLRMNRSFDLVVSLEVAEHLPVECADTFVDYLVGLSEYVLFSAAIPHQWGTNHINEQWPEYWTKKFSQRGYVVIDCLRKKIWQNNNVEPWYAQNILLFVREASVKANKRLVRELENTRMSQLSVVHPKIYLYHAEGLILRNIPLRRILSVLPFSVSNTFRRRVFILWQDIRRVLAKTRMLA